jgi:hypothetical protein
MHEYDVALKRILTRPGSALLFALTGASELRWLNVELPKVNNLRVDLLGAAGRRTGPSRVSEPEPEGSVVSDGRVPIRHRPPVRAVAEADRAVRGREAVADEEQH